MDCSELDQQFRLIKRLARRGGPLATGSPKATVNQQSYGFWLGERWVPTPERQQLHKFIIATQRIAATTLSEAPHAVVMSGPPGAGKSTARSHHLHKAASAYQVVDADSIKESLIQHAVQSGALSRELKAESVQELENQGVRFRPMEFASLVHTESVFIANQLKEDVLDSQGHIVLDQVLSDERQALVLGEDLRKRGYSITVINVEASREVVEGRIYQRYLEQNIADPTAGGRGIPSDVLDWTYRHGRDDVSVAREVSRKLAESNSHVVEYQQWRTPNIDAAPARGACWRRPQIGTPSMQKVESSD